MFKTPAARAAEEIIEKLEGRGGFDHWWGGIARTDQREVIDAITGIIKAMSAPAAPAPRPKLEIITGGSDREIYVDGRYIADETDPVIMAAQRIARALGADVDETDDPSPQPYTYFIAYRWMSGFDHGPGQVWHTRATPIEGIDSLEESRLKIKRDNPKLGEIVITNFICTDGPS